MERDIPEGEFIDVIGNHRTVTASVRYWNPDNQLAKESGVLKEGAEILLRPVFRRIVFADQNELICIQAVHLGETQENDCLVYVPFETILMWSEKVDRMRE